LLLNILLLLDYYLIFKNLVLISPDLVVKLVSVTLVIS